MAEEAKIPPQNLEAEQSVLGALLIDKDSIAKVVEILHPESFYREAHQHIYQAILNLFSKSEPIDLITVTDELSRLGKLDAVGGRVYVSDIINSVPTSANVEYYAKIVEDKAILRELISQGSQLVSEAFRNETEVDGVLDFAQKSIFDIAQRKIRQGFVKIKDLLDAVMKKMEETYDQGSHITGIPSGYIDLDELTGGFQQADLIVIAGRPSMGKTALALNIAQNVGIRHNLPVAIFSLEMSKESLTQRILCSEAEIDSSHLKSKNLHDHEWKKLGRALGRLSEAPLYVDDTPALSPLELRAKARKLQMEKGVALIIIDFMQLMRGSRRSYENRTQEVSEISRSIKAVAREINVPIIALSQLSRAVEQRQDQFPRLSDLRESGEIEQVADLVLFIHREAYYDRMSDKGNLAQLILAKQRNGPTGTVELTFRKEITKFGNREKVEVEALG
ncbi:MAG: replicative DNA helicase [Candidatus Margulisbacteria bacterium]|nr:replicative DNA helicase [Candidatus Margulisiibacteriota bacterium]